MIKRSFETEVLIGASGLQLDVHALLRRLLPSFLILFVLTARKYHGLRFTANVDDNDFIVLGDPLKCRAEHGLCLCQLYAFYHCIYSEFIQTPMKTGEVKGSLAHLPH